MILMKVSHHTFIIVYQKTDIDFWAAKSQPHQICCLGTIYKKEQ